MRPLRYERSSRPRLHSSAFHLHGTRGTVQAYKRVAQVKIRPLPYERSSRPRLHRSTFGLHGTQGTMQAFKRQTDLQSVTEFARFRVNELHR